MTKEKNLNKSKLVVITGVTGKLGEAYLDELAKHSEVKCVGFTRREPENRLEGVEYRYADLLNKHQVRKAVASLNLEEFDEVLLIHPVGMFKFELMGFPQVDKNKDGIDDEVFASNVLTFLHTFKALKERVKRIKRLKFTACAFGSISDKYSIPFWASYTRSKDLLREIIKSAAINDKTKLTRGIFVNVSTTDTGNERNLRPFANKKYWLKTEEIVRASLPLLLKNKEAWSEINIYKPNPKFNATWYTNHENVLERWQKQMGVRLDAN